MDTLSVTASVIAVIGLAGQVIKCCQLFVKSIKNAPHDLCNILIEVGCIKCILETLQLRLQLSTTFTDIKAVNDPITGCKAVLEALLLSLFPESPGNSKKRKRNELKSAYAKLAWPFKQEKARKLLEDIARYISTITLILTTDVG
jgi:hypothetical protein